MKKRQKKEIDPEHLDLLQERARAICEIKEEIECCIGEKNFYNQLERVETALQSLLLIYSSYCWHSGVEIDDCKIMSVAHIEECYNFFEKEAKKPVRKARDQSKFD